MTVEQLIEYLRTLPPTNKVNVSDDRFFGPDDDRNAPIDLILYVLNP